MNTPAANATIPSGYDKGRKAFGKFAPGANLPLRKFERQLEVKARSGQEAWKSNFTSVQNLLDHLQRYTKSESSREKYLRHLMQFCTWTNRNCEDMVKLPRDGAELLLQQFADTLAGRNSSRAYVNSVIKRLKVFFRVNGFTDGKQLHVHGYFVPTRYRKVAEYIPTKAQVYAMADAAGTRRDRAIVLTLWSSGLRVSTLCAVNFGDISDDLAKEKPCIMINVFPRMKDRVADACKGLISYYSFICPEAGEAIRSYLLERQERLGTIESDDPLFHSNWTLWTRRERTNKRLDRRAVGLVVKRAARLSGLQEWKYVSSHCLRKAFESVLRSPTIDGGRMDKGTQEFLMGHILPGTQDPYYDRTKIDFHYEEYSKLDFSRGGRPLKMTDKLISVSEMEQHFASGWMFVAKINDQKAVVRKGA